MDQTGNRVEVELRHLRVDDLIARGCVQLSRQYRSVGVPPPGKTGALDRLREVHPAEYDRIIDGANRLAIHELFQHDPRSSVELTPDEFCYYLRVTGRKPGGKDLVGATEQLAASEEARS